MENLGAKYQKLLEENAYSLAESDSAWFRVQISSPNRKAVLIHQMGEPALE